MNGAFARFVADYPAFIETLRDRSEQMEIPRLELDRIAGLAEGHSGKLLSTHPVKNFGMKTVWPVLQSLGLVLCVLEDPAARDLTLLRRHVGG